MNNRNFCDKETLSAIESYTIWKNLISWKYAKDEAERYRDDQPDYAMLRYPIKKDDKFTKEFIERWTASCNSIRCVSAEEFFSVLCEE